MPWGPDELSPVCERVRGELGSAGIFLMVRDDEAKTRDYSVSTVSPEFLRNLPFLLRGLANQTKKDWEYAAAHSEGTPLIMPQGKYDEHAGKLLRELKVHGLVLMIVRGKLGNGVSIGGLWRSDMLFNAFAETADQIEQDLKAIP